MLLAMAKSLLLKICWKKCGLSEISSVKFGGCDSARSPCPLKAHFLFLLTRLFLPHSIIPLSHTRGFHSCSFLMTHRMHRRSMNVDTRIRSRNGARLSLVSCAFGGPRKFFPMVTTSEKQVVVFVFLLWKHQTLHSLNSPHSGNNWPKG